MDELPEKVLNLLMILAIAVFCYLFLPKIAKTVVPLLVSYANSTSSRAATAHQPQKAEMPVYSENGCDMSFSHPKRIYDHYNESGQPVGFTGRAKVWMTIACRDEQTGYGDNDEVFQWTKLTQRLHLDCSRHRVWTEYAVAYINNDAIVHELESGVQGSALEQSEEGVAISPEDPVFKYVYGIELCNPK